MDQDAGIAAILEGSTPLDGYARYAVYWAPRPGSPLAAAGAAWLGYDPVNGQSDAARAADRRVTAPRRYGLHATLKAPLVLAEGRSVAALDEALQGLSKNVAPAQGAPLTIASDLGFLALLLSAPSPAIDALATKAVRALDPFRAPLTDAERARRGADRLDPAARARLEAWGYPHVMEGFRFHITLTDRLEPAAAAATAAELAPRFADYLDQPFVLDALALFGDPGGGRPFRQLRHYPLTGRTGTGEA
ncbi:MAG: DUF1045 domain-containing protein [Pseudomonadota bacterium]